MPHASATACQGFNRRPDAGIENRRDNSNHAAFRVPSLPSTSSTASDDSLVISRASLVASSSSPMPAKALPTKSWTNSSPHQSSKGAWLLLFCIPTPNSSVVEATDLF